MALNLRILRASPSLLAPSSVSHCHSWPSRHYLNQVSGRRLAFSPRRKISIATTNYKLPRQDTPNNPEEPHLLLSQSMFAQCQCSVRCVISANSGLSRSYRFLSLPQPMLSPWSSFMSLVVGMTPWLLHRFMIFLYGQVGKASFVSRVSNIFFNPSFTS